MLYYFWLQFIKSNPVNLTILKNSHQYSLSLQIMINIYQIFKTENLIRFHTTKYEYHQLSTVAQTLAMILSIYNNVMVELWCSFILFFLLFPNLLYFIILCYCCYEITPFYDNLFTYHYFSIYYVRAMYLNLFEFLRIY